MSFLDLGPRTILAGGFRLRSGAALVLETLASLSTFIQAGVGAVSRSVESKQRESISVKDFGAVGDGVADDTAAIQAAFDSVIIVGAATDTVSGGAVIRAPRGRYKITAALTMPSLSRFAGDGINATILDCTTMTSGAALTIAPAGSSGRVCFASVSGMYIVGPGSTSAVDGISITTGVPLNIVVEEVWLYKFRTALRLTEISNCAFQRFRAAECQRGVWIDATSVSTSSRFSHYYIDQNEQGVYLDRCQTMTFDGSGVVENNTRTTSLSDGNAGMLEFGCQNIECHGTHFEANVVDIILDVKTATQTQFALFDHCMFNPVDGSTNILVKNARGATFNRCFYLCTTVQYTKIWDVSSSTNVLSPSIGDVGSLRFRNEAGTILDYPPGTNSTQAITSGPSFKLINGYVYVLHPNVNFPAFRSIVYGEATTRFDLDVSGKMHWGNGTGAQDTILYRSAAGLLVTDTALAVQHTTAIPAGGTAGAGIRVSSTANFGVFFGSGAPSLSAAKGSLYPRSDGSGVGDRLYVNTNGSTTWTAVTTVA